MTTINGISKSMILLSQEPLSDRLKLASLNTLLGMGIVFAVLALLVLIISLFKFVPYLTGEKPTNSEQEDNFTPVDETRMTLSQEEDNLVNDQELVAVITAAIAAYQTEALTTYSGDVLAGGFVVRSIRKINN